MKKNDAQEPIYCIESLFIHLLYHGTSHSSYNVGPMFIMDLMHMINSNKLGNKILSLPISEEHTKKEILYVCKQIENFFNLKNK